jgi:polysaccharide export outer membrane protein
MVNDAGTINVPFAGEVEVAGRTTTQVEKEIVARLAGRAHQPQAVVRMVQNEARNVTIVGEVGASRRVPITARGERLLDVLASAGGPRQPVSKTTVQLSRAGVTTSMPLDAIIRDPAQNIRVQPDDVVTVAFQPYSFIALGAVSQNAEVPFEGAGLTVAQALGRIGGLRVDSADIGGVFIFRLEDPAAVDPAILHDVRRMDDGRIPVIYRLNLREPASFFAAQSFAIRDDDLLYVSTALGADLQRFVSTISSVAFSTIAIGDAVK